MIVKRILFILLCIFMLVSCGKDYVSEQEPNDLFNQAMDIQFDKEIRGFLQKTTDRDIYRIIADTDSVADINVTGVKGINIAIRLWEEKDGRTLLKVIDDVRKSSPERFANLFMKTGMTYYAEITYGEKDSKKASAQDYYSLTIKKRDAGNDEIEPNDMFEQATILIPGTEISGYFSPSYNRSNENKDTLHREEDWFEITVDMETETPVLMDVFMTGVQGINSELYLFGPDKQEISKSDNGQRGSGEEIRGIGIKKSGRYYVMVTCKNYEANHDDPYYLTAVIRESDSSKEMEPNGDIESANIIINNHVGGEISNGGDADFYCYKPIDEFGIYRILLEPAGDDDFSVGIYDAKKVKITEINNSGAGAGETFPNLKMTDQFYLSVSSRIGGEGKGKYNLTVTPLQNIEDMELEPNDNKGEATKITNGRIAGFISHKGDKDFFLMDYEMRVNALFDITGVKGGDIKVSITDPLGYIIKTEQVRGAGNVKIKEMIEKRGYLIVESLNDNYENPYKIRIKVAE